MSNVHQSPGVNEAQEPSLAEEIRAIPYEPLLPVEKTLIACSLVVGVLLLGLLLWVSSTYFPVESLKPTPATPAAVR